MINAEELLKLPKLGKEDTFTFGCNMCGKCCREREDVLLTPLDLFKIAKYLKKSIQEVVSEYCESYEGAESKFAIVRIKPREYRRTCPFSKGKCLIYPVRPVVCALYPLGRMSSGDGKEFTYFLQPVRCGNRKQTQTIRQWLDGFSILEEEDFTIMWHRRINELSALLRELYSKKDFNHEPVTVMLLTNLYVLYDLEKDFMPQFMENCPEVLRLVRKISDEGDCFRAEQSK